MTCKTCEKPCNPIYVRLPTDSNQPHSKIINKLTPEMTGTEYAQPTTGKLLTEEEAEAIKVRFTNAPDPDLNIISCTEDVATLVLEDIPALLADRAARIERNREAIEKLFAKMNELDTPKRGELHLLMISILS